jgi:DNA-binding Xre family transcriptional regulator
MRTGRIAPLITAGKVVDTGAVSLPVYVLRMVWTAEDRERRFPEVQRGWEILGAMVKRRRAVIGWSQRDLQRASGLHQSGVSRLERGILSGIRFSTFARVVAAMNGLDPSAPHPPRARWDWWD